MQIMMMQHKRSPISVDQSSFMNLMPKRLKTDAALSSKEKKEKVSERISALQQLVSPYGKTDTASVLLEAMEYINFLHEQVKVLSAPYLYSTPSQIQGRMGPPVFPHPMSRLAFPPGQGTMQPQSQRLMSRPDFFHCWSCEQQRCRYMGTHQNWAP